MNYGLKDILAFSSVLNTYDDVTGLLLNEKFLNCLRCHKLKNDCFVAEVALIEI